jgi:hypothetical protein
LSVFAALRSPPPPHTLTSSLFLLPLFSVILSPSYLSLLFLEIGGKMKTKIKEKDTEKMM